MELSPKERHALVIGISPAPDNGGDTMGEKDDGKGEDEMEEAHGAASNLAEAIHSKDPAAIVEAFMHLQECTEDMEKPEEDGKDDGDEEGESAEA
jgi:hypothetical protein